MKFMTIVLGYAYWPLLYFGVYLPFIVPRLDGWHHIPFWITWPAMLAFIVILAALGTRCTHKAIILHAFGIAFFLQAFIFTMSKFHMPSFLKSYEARLFSHAILPILSLVVVVIAMGEVGHLVMRFKQRTSNKALEPTP